ncbi:guanosine polyphosphate pyrophosphohydrolase/synthetase-like protein [Rickettsia rhipicephali str. 3-7-female6-CWPP]|uniref:Guanosine polyphosphate pyrophosphohydrolase/synthetase-like protein n=1 Tax=Rickettsia rhipicephali (strain 3-7-female6-CWPP) TaxID=1105113 RepID=A0AAI8AAJ1_RICR3|nr:guanosine polyphosphate pyrophosphohydrolase/synthetase-like protein [Rickettsia rhipicephali str. 3-7-female6-CWPP]
MRQSGDPYYSHPIEVTIILAEFVAEEVPKLFTSNMINAALLHYPIEDTELTEEMINGLFGAEVAQHVEGLTRIKLYGKITAEESLNLLIKQKRYNTAFIKLFDRVHNIQTLGAKSPEKAKKIIEETLINFVNSLPIAAYFKIPVIKERLLFLCYQYLYPKDYQLERSLTKFEDNFQLLYPAFHNIIFPM